MTKQQIAAVEAQDTAFELVLGAEREGRESVARCEREMRQLLEQARASADDVHARAAARIERLRSKLAERAAARISRLDADTSTPDSPLRPDTGQASRLEAAVAALAVELTGEAP